MPFLKLVQKKQFQVSDPHFLLLVLLQSYVIFPGMNKLHENISAMYHRGKLDQIPWSHHQKTCIIDDKVAFVGGLGTHSYKKKCWF